MSQWPQTYQHILYNNLPYNTCCKLSTEYNYVVILDILIQTLEASQLTTSGNQNGFWDSSPSEGRAIILVRK